MRVRRWVAAGIAAGMMLSLSACGSDTGQSSGGGDIAAASLTQANFSQTVTTAQHNVKSVHMDATIDAAGQTGTISGNFSGFTDIASLSMDMSLQMAGKQFTMRLVDKVLYVRGVGLGSDPSKPWLKLDLNDPNNPLASILDSANPQSFTAYLHGVKNLDDLGTETVDGVETHHYAVTIDTAKAMAANPAFKGHDLSKLNLPGQITTNVWLNKDSLPVKMSIPLGKIGSFEAHFSRYGEPVSVKAPPANQVSDFNLGRA